MTRVRLRDGFQALAAALVLMLLGAAAQAETRVALVIGNGDYKNTNRLANPRNDATDIAAALTRNGFETITGFDLDKAGMEDAEIRFARKARDADVAIFYYSGHAIQYAGTNYLLPVDALIKDSTDLRRLAKVDDIVDDLQQAKTLRVLILDSCRDNPLAEELKRSLGSNRGANVQRGLARLDSSRGMIVAYSTQAGQTADDGSGRNSPYTAALLRQIETPEEISVVFKRTAAEVARNGRQLPELSLSFFGDFYLKEPVAAAAPPPKLETATPSPRPEPAAPRPTLEAALPPPTSEPALHSPTSEPDAQPASKPDVQPSTSEPATALSSPVKEARLPAPSDPLDLVTDCDRLASIPFDPQRPRGVSGVDFGKIDTVPALAACNSAMAQHPEIARFAFQTGIIDQQQKDYAGALTLYEKAAGLGSAIAMTSIGGLHAEGRGVTKDFAEARKWFEKGAAAGLPEAMVAVGMMYRLGKGVPIDASAASQWFEKAAATREPEVLGDLGDAFFYSEPKDYAEAKKWYQKAADGGSLSGMKQLGLIFGNGYGVAQDYVEARKWYEKAANAGASDAMIAIGDLYLFGRGVPMDYSAAKPWYEKAAAANDRAAFVRLGDIYFYAIGKMQDYPEARKWYQKAADAGSVEGMSQLGGMYRNGNGVVQDHAEAKNWYQRAADAGSLEAMSKLGAMYRNGDGVAVNAEEAKKWYEKAAAAGSAEAMNELGQMNANDAEAMKWYEKSAAAGSSVAMVNLAKLYETGSGILRDRAAARKWYQKAADAGNKIAIASLAGMDAADNKANDEAAKANAEAAKSNAKTAASNPDTHKTSPKKAARSGR